MKNIITNIIDKISKVFAQWQNRRLLARINRVYENYDDTEDKKLLDAYRRSFRKLIKDKW